MRSKRIPAEEQYRLIMECRQSGLTDHQWCVEHDIKPGTFYNWVKRLRQKGCMDFPASTGRSYSAPESQEVVRVDFHDTDTRSYEQPLNMIPTSTERNNISVANDTIYRTFIAYEEGILTKDETIARLKVKKLYNQMTFTTASSLKELKYIGQLPIGRDCNE